MQNSISAVWQRLKAFIATEVPADVAACEFDCRETDCPDRDWQNCQRRTQKAEAIQHLMPKQ
ncbi:MAG: hypothetical protein ACFB0G_16145 [Leptolyngbyaceae cyanobacterium]